MVWGFNEDIAKKPKEKMNLEVLRNSSEPATKYRISYFVDLAKSEALDAMGEDQAAEDLAVKYV